MCFDDRNRTTPLADKWYFSAWRMVVRLSITLIRDGSKSQI
jgi:hypothetical protein